MIVDVWYYIHHVEVALSTEERTSYRFRGYCANIKSWRYCLNFAQLRKDCNVSCSSCARRVNTTHFSGSSFPTIVKTISREEKYKII